jgi:hypothetical protein
MDIAKPASAASLDSVYFECGQGVPDGIMPLFLRMAEMKKTQPANRYGSREIHAIRGRA